MTAIRRVLVFCPMYQLYDATLKSIFELRWDGPLYRLFSNDNPYNDAANSYFRAVGHQNNIQLNMQRARRTCLEQGFDALLTIEADVIAPPDALQKLAEVDADVVYGLYVWRRFAAPMWSAYCDVTPRGGHSVSVLGAQAMRDSWGHVIDCVGVGFGCTLIHRHVLEKVDFHTGDWRDTDFPDHHFSLDCQRGMFVQKCHTGVRCGHIDGNNHRILWPAPDGYSTQPLVHMKNYGLRPASDEHPSLMGQCNRLLRTIL